MEKRSIEQPVDLSTASTTPDMSIEKSDQVFRDTKAPTTDSQTTDSLTTDAVASNTNHITGFKLAFITIALSCSIFLVALDESIITTAIPKITDRFASLDDVGWYGSAYLLTSCAFQFTYGKLYTFYPVKWVFVTAIAFFETGSLICGVSPNSTAFIIGRSIAGIGCAGIISGALLIISQAVPIRKRPIYFGGVGAIAAMASVAAPIMGGAFADSRLTWRWCFYINLPIGGATIAIIVFLFKDDPAQITESMTFKQKLSKFDLPGTAFLLPALVSILLAFQYGGAQYAWSDGRVIALLVLFVVLSAGFVAVQMWQKENGTLPARIICQRNIAFGALFAMLIDGAFYILDYYLPIWFQTVKGKTAIQSGIRTLPLVIATVVANMSAGVLVSKLGYYVPFMIGSTVLTAIGTGLLTTLDHNSNVAGQILFQIVAGAGIGMGMQQSLVAAQTVLTEEDLAMGISIVVFFQTLGPTLCISVAQNVFQNRLSSNLGRTVPGLDQNALLETGATNLVSKVPSADLPSVLAAYNLSLTQTWYCAVGLATLSIIGALGMEWKKIEEEKEKEGSTTESL